MNQWQNISTTVAQNEFGPGCITRVQDVIESEYFHDTHKCKQ